MITVAYYSMISILATNNTATYPGGALYIRNSNISVQRVLFEYNTAINGGGLFIERECTVSINESKIGNQYQLNK